MTQSTKRFRVALSFSGEHREFIQDVARTLANEVGKAGVLYDKFHEGEFAVLNADVKLQRLYREESALVVVFISRGYEGGSWCGLEWRAIRDLASETTRKDTDASLPLMFVRFDDTAVKGIFPNTDGSVIVGDRTPEEIAGLIMDRLRLEEMTGCKAPLLAIRPFNRAVQRRALFQPFEDFARHRDIVFALGGVGSGLKTFLHQFATFLEENQDHSFASADFDPTIYELIHKTRSAKRNAIRDIAEFSSVDDSRQFELKCLLATMAYMTYFSLSRRFRDGIRRVVPDYFGQGPVEFAEWYFNQSGAMFLGELGPIVEHFFTTVQRLAESTGAAPRVIVFMPWRNLAACFTRRHLDVDQKALALAFWRALGDFAARGSLAATTDRFDKVCLIVAGAEIPFGHSAPERPLVEQSLWPLPPFDETEVSALLGMLSGDLAGKEHAQIVIDWSGGSPWYVKVILSCAQFLLERNMTSNPMPGLQLIGTACTLAEDILTRPETVEGDLKREIVAYCDRVRDVLDTGEATDPLIEQAWSGTEAKRDRGLSASLRVEAFVASGLGWLRGDPWDRTSSQSVFYRYEILYFRRAGRLPLAVYRAVMGATLELAEY